MIASFQWPTTHHRSGGLVALYEFANGLARRGHEIHFIHGPAWRDLITSLDDLWYAFEPAIKHHLVADLADPSLPEADIVFATGQSERLGLPFVIMQGFRMLPFEMERGAFRSRNPKACIARWLLEVGADLGVPEQQLGYVPMGIDHQRFADRVPSGDRRYDVAMWCNPHPTKGWRVGWKALHEARRQVPDLRAVVFSALPPHDDDLDADPAIDVVVGLGQQRLADEVFNASRVFLQPSFHEGFGFTAVEAMACGAALVTTDNGGSRDYAFPGQTAVVVPPGDASGLADGIVAMVTDEPERARLAIAGEQWVRTFDWDIGAAELEGMMLRYLNDPEAFRGAPFDDSELVLRW